MSRKDGKVLVIVGAMHGSEGKGVVAHSLANDFDVAVRTGAPNAGHSIVHEGKLYKMQSIPCAWVNPKCKLVLGAGALINLDILMKEIKGVEKAFPGVKDRLFIDEAAGILEKRHHEEEGGIDGGIHKRMGSTGEGVGAARRDRLARDPKKFRLARDCEELNGLQVVDTVEMLNTGIKNGENVMLEGTQGCGLSLIHGQWPFVTTSDTNAAQFAADAGIPPHWITDVMLVTRTYPIRVAGPSGPMFKEISWDDVSKRVGKKVVEKTTVTRKVRRVGEWDEPQMKKAVMINAPSSVAITFIDYLSPEDEGKTDFDSLSEKALDFIHYVERSFATDVTLIGTGWNDKTGWAYINRMSS